MREEAQIEGRSQKERVLHAVQRADAPLCDDCLAAMLGISPRQSVNTKARELVEAGAIQRERGTCASCGGAKLVNWRHGEHLPRLS